MKESRFGAFPVPLLTPVRATRCVARHPAVFPRSMGMFVLPLGNVTVLNFRVGTAVGAARARIYLWGNDAVFGTVTLVIQTATSTYRTTQNENQF